MTDIHNHALGEAPDPLNRPVDAALMSEVVGAAFDGCVPCQTRLMPLLTEDPGTTARIVELACVQTTAVIGGLPPSMTDASAPGLPSQPFRRLARSGADGENARMWEISEQMSPQERREAADTALDLLAGYLQQGPRMPSTGV